MQKIINGKRYKITIGTHDGIANVVVKHLCTGNFQEFNLQLCHLDNLLKLRTTKQVFDYCYANPFSQIPPTTNTGTKSELGVIANSLGVVISEGDTLLVSDSSNNLESDSISHSPVQSPRNFQDADSVIGSLAGEYFLPVAIQSVTHSTADSDTLFSYRDLNTIVSALGHYIDYISKSDLKELQHLNIDFEADRKASILRLISFTERIKSMSVQMRGVAI